MYGGLLALRVLARKYEFKDAVGLERLRMHMAAGYNAAQQQPRSTGAAVERASPSLCSCTALNSLCG